MVGHHHVDRRSRDPLDFLIVGLVIFLQEVIRQQENIRPPFAEWGQVDRKHIQPVIQILTETAGPDPLFQIPTGGRNDPHIDVNQFVPSHPLEGTLLQNPQEPNLDSRCDIANFVQEQRAPIRQLKPALPLLRGPGKGSFFMAEQLAFNQILRESRTVDADKRIVFPGTSVMNGPRHQFLPRPGLAPDQNRGRAVGHLRHLIVHAPHFLGIADQIMGLILIAQLAPQSLVFSLQAFLLDNLLADTGHRLRQQIRHKPEKFQILFQPFRLGGRPVNTDGSDHLAVMDDGRANKCDWTALSGLCPVEKAGILADIRNNLRLSGLGHTPRDPLAQLVLSPLMLLRSHAACRLNHEDIGVRTAQGKRPK